MTAQGQKRRFLQRVVCQVSPAADMRSERLCARSAITGLMYRSKLLHLMIYSSASGASPQTDEACRIRLSIADGRARSSTHSKRRSNDSLALPSCFHAPFEDIATSWHSPSDLIASPRAKARLEAFCAPLPLRKLASEEKEYFGSLKKLDTSASSLATQAKLVGSPCRQTEIARCNRWISREPHHVTRRPALPFRVLRVSPLTEPK